MENSLVVLHHKHRIKLKYDMKIKYQQLMDYCVLNALNLLRARLV